MISFTTTNASVNGGYDGLPVLKMPPLMSPISLLHYPLLRFCRTFASAFGLSFPSPNQNKHNNHYRNHKTVTPTTATQQGNH